MGSKKSPTAGARSAVLSTGGAREVGSPIVGMGASAGGLEAFEQFFRHVPANSRFFVKEETGYRVKKDIREMLVFATQNVLETSREELQSVNEELVTVNAEFQGRIEQLAAMQNTGRWTTSSMGWC